MEVHLTHPVTQVAVAIDKARQNRFAFGIDDLRVLRHFDLAALTHILESPIANDDNSIHHRRASGAVDQRAADNRDWL
jgi:hypothetical protein